MTPMLLFVALTFAQPGALPDRDVLLVQKKPITLNEAMKLVSPALVRECGSKIASALKGKGKIVGQFSVGIRNNTAAAIIEKMIDPEEVIALIVPTKVVFGALIYRGSCGCSYYVRNGKLSFNKLMGQNFFPRRYTLLPGED